ncbi:hypothetical protein [Fulvivirga lutimaris]|uniref:hypothetical protein n=1 Tax=Fulvivirga lutimaris TaxID=1819566 RepID=UPI0012BD1E59|nr:hypothetical protein [Fulvivirga lutimaris]MTI39082.1 hypothetical protein [Fulvivirga lutimaris]
MELRDFIVTPIWLFIIYIVAYWLRPRFTDVNTKRYFIPALTVKILGAIAVGVVYQFYYGYGDTFWYHTYGSRIIWETIINSPIEGFRLIFEENQFTTDLYPWASKIRYYEYDDTYFIVRLSAICDLFTFSSYIGTAMLFSVIGFSGLWALFKTFYSRFTELHRNLALAILFIPSIAFWGSGILKDTVTLSALGWLVYSVDQLLFKKNKSLIILLVLIINVYILFVVKKYILLTFVPCSIIWIYLSRISKISSLLLKTAIAPFLIIFFAIFSYWSVIKISENDARYSMDKIAETARITAYDIAYQTGKGAGSTYELGQLDGTFESMMSLFPKAVVVSLFRPFPWEVKTPLMLLASLESSVILLLTLLVIFRGNWISLLYGKIDPIVIFSILFALTFAFAVGVSTFNFGTLMRYKIPLMPFYLSFIVVVINSVTKE